MTTTETTETTETTDTQPTKAGETLLLDVDHARRIAASTVAASRDNIRPILGCTLISVTNGVLQTVQTDSYRMSWTMTPIDHENVEPFLVVARELEAAFKQPVRDYPAGIPVEFGESLSPAGHQRRHLRVTLGTSVVTLGGQYGTFPNWRQLIDSDWFGRVGKAIVAGKLFNRGDVDKTQQAATENAEAGTFGYNPKYLADLNKIHGYTDGDRGDIPVRPIPPATPLKPALWTWIRDAQCGAYLLMPVRV